ncbi:MAG: M48 family metallopeptidase [Rhodoferax sp.]|nr:M48 family metallopeptidase [Rhodoferax sp.]
MTQTTPNFSISLALTIIFVLALLAGFTMRLWLSTRQIRHVAKFRTSVPTAFSKNIALSAHQKAADYTIAKMCFGLVELAVGTAMVLCWTLLGGLSALNQGLISLLGFGIVQQAALLTVFVVIASLIDIPFTIYQTFVIEDRFGFNKVTLKLWLTDLIKSGLVSASIGVPLISSIVWMMGATGEWWWLWTWGVWMGFNLILMLVYPTWIAPLFNKFKPLENQELGLQVTALMQRCGFAAQGLFVMDGSKRSSHANAYFTGFGASKRVVFYDTLLSKLTTNEVKAVLAHELGHFKHKHIVKRMASLFVASLLGFALLGYLKTQVWFYTGLGVQPNLNAANDALALILFLLVLPMFGFFITPLAARLSRQNEFEADAYAVSHTNGADLASALLKMYEDNASTLTPDPFYARFHYSHPPASERLARISV